MDFCTTVLLALALVLAGDLMVLLNAHRFVKRNIPDPLSSGGEVKAGMDSATIVRVISGISMMAAAGIFLFILSRNGCLG